MVLWEVAQTPSLEKRERMLLLVRDVPKLAQGPEVFELAEELVQANLVPDTKVEDAVHLAIAALHRVDVLVSWNFRHTVNLKTKKNLPLVLAKNGFFHHDEIISPYEYTGGQVDNPEFTEDPVIIEVQQIREAYVKRPEGSIPKNFSFQPCGLRRLLAPRSRLQAEGATQSGDPPADLAVLSGA